MIFFLLRILIENEKKIIWGVVNGWGGGEGGGEGGGWNK